MKLCFVCSAGGHFTEALKIYKGLEGEKFFVTFDSPNLRGRKEKIVKVPDTRRNPVRFLSSFFRQLSVFLEERPDVIISTGAGIAVPMCIFAKLAGKKIIHLEIGCNVTKPSLAGRLIYPMADLLIVEWENLLDFYPKAKYGGLLI